VTPANGADLFRSPEIDGGLVGGASLVAKDFAAIATAAGGGLTAGSAILPRPLDRD